MSPYLPVAHDQDAVAVEDGGDTVCDDQHCAAPETFTDCVLDEDVRLQVERGRGLINKDDLIDKKQGRRQPPQTQPWV